VLVGLGLSGALALPGVSVPLAPPPGGQFLIPGRPPALSWLGSPAGSPKTFGALGQGRLGWLSPFPLAVQVLCDKDMSSIHTTMLGDRGRGDQRGYPNREGGPKLIWFESPRWRPKSSSSPSWVPGPVCHKTGHTGAYGLCFRRSTYVWKAN